MARTPEDSPVDRAAAAGPRRNESLPAVETSQSGRRVGMLRRLGQAVPTLIVIGLLAGVGAYGHHSGWKLPRFSALAITVTCGCFDRTSATLSSCEALSTTMISNA